MLQMYTKLIAGDKVLWMITNTIFEHNLQEELRHICWMIEEATIEEIGEEIAKRKGVLSD
jgi:hypothetical protein